MFFSFTMLPTLAVVWSPAPLEFLLGLPTLTNSCNKNGMAGTKTQTFPQDTSLINEYGLRQIAEQDDADSERQGQS